MITFHEVSSRSMLLEGLPDEIKEEAQKLRARGFTIEWIANDEIMVIRKNGGM